MFALSTILGRESGLAYLVMEFLDGETLAARIAKGLCRIRRVAGGHSDCWRSRRGASRGTVYRDLDRDANLLDTRRP